MSDIDDLVLREYDEPETRPPSQQQAVTVRDAVQAVDRVPLPEPKPQVTAAQAKIEAVANLTASAYARASELQLTPEESKALQAEFPDEAFKPGAAGKESLIYIEHAFLRDRLNQVIGLGQWALIPRSRWAEDFTSQNGKPASRVYVEAMLMVRGCFVSEAVGEMEYWKTNASQNYGDAVEGAKTAALRRCCKEFGIGLQAWKKDWCEGWWQRKHAKDAETRNTNRKQPSSPPPQRQPSPPPPPTTSKAPDMPAEERFPVCNVLTIKEVHSKPESAKKWTAYFIKFTDGVGDLEAATFDKKIADLANELADTQENCELITRPGRKEGSREIVRISRTEQPPTTASSDEVPMEFDAQGQPMGVTP